MQLNDKNPIILMLIQFRRFATFVKEILIGKDNRMKQTRIAIQQTFIDLAKEKPVDKITVKEIVKRCGINRNSFYYHYEDLPDLIQSIIEDQIDEAVQSNRHKDVQQICIASAMVFQNNLDFCRNIYSSKNRDILEIRLSKKIARIVQDFLLNDYLPNYTIAEEDKQIILQFYRTQLCGLIKEWLRSGMNYDIARRFERMFELREGSLEHMLQIAQKTRPAQWSQKNKAAASDWFPVEKAASSAWAKFPELADLKL